MNNYIVYDHSKFSDTIRLFYFFAKFNKKNCLRVSFSSSREHIMQILAD